MRAHLRALLLRVRTIARVLVDLFPLTALGVLIAAGSVAALVSLGVRRIDLVVLVMGAVGAALAVLAVLVVTATALGLYLSLRKRAVDDTLNLECGYAARTGFSLPSLWYVPFVKLRWSWVTPEATVNTVSLRRRFHEEVTPQRRGIYDDVLRRIEVSDAFGLTRVAFTVRERRAVRFAPSVGALKNMHVVRSVAGGDNLSHPAGPPEGERADMRHYVPGDPIKFVLWKVFARSRVLVVRTPERAISPVRQTVAYLVTGDGDEAAAGAARVAVESGALGSEWVLGSDLDEHYARAHTQAMALLAKSARATPAQHGSGLSRFLDTAVPGGAVGRAVVFVPAVRGPWLDRVLAAVRARSSPNQAVAPVEFVVCADGISRRPKPSWLARVALDPRRAAHDGAVAYDELMSIVAALSAARARVLIVDRVAGRVFAEGTQRVREAA